MIIAATIAGLFVGWLVNRAADYLPRYAVDSDRSLSSGREPKAPAWFRLVSAHGVSDRSRLGLELGVELLSGAVFAMLWGSGVPSWGTLLVAGSYIFLALVAVIDLKYRLVLNVMTYPAMVVVAAVQVLVVREHALNTMLGGALAFAIFFLTARLRPDELGGGDVKLAGLIGLAFGFPQILWALIVGTGMGAGVAIYLICLHRQGMKSHIPYAPFLCFGAMVALVFNPLVTG